MAKTKTKAKAKNPTRARGKAKPARQHVHCTVWWQGGGTVFMPFKRNEAMSGARPWSRRTAGARWCGRGSSAIRCRP